jgi:SOS response associated peptidase (SRAP)
MTTHPQGSSDPVVTKGSADRRSMPPGRFDWGGTKGSTAPVRALLRPALNFECERASQGGRVPLRTCTIVTTTANETVAPLHDRMPVILPPSAWDAWLDPGNGDTVTLSHLLVPAPAELLTVHPASSAVNSRRNNGPELFVEAMGDQLVR